MQNLAHAASKSRRTDLHLGPWLLGGLFALALILAPWVFTSSRSHTMLSQMGVAIIACLSYNMLLGQGGMLSLGHALYSGMGALGAIHLLQILAAGQMPFLAQWPVSLVPLVGGVVGLGLAALLGWITTRSAGTPFAMITLGLSELVGAMALMLPGFFGGEGGVSGNRVVGAPVWGITWGPQIELYYLIALYVLVCTALMFAFTHTPLGRMLHAVRDNPERVAFIGCDTHKVRYMVFVIAGFFAGIAGGLSALNFEIVTVEVVGLGQSGHYLLFTVLGGVTVFWGPIVGAVLWVFSSLVLSEWTPAWRLYLGGLFVFFVMHAPGGVAGLITLNLRRASWGFWRVWGAGVGALCVTGLVGFLGAVALIEMIYHLQRHDGLVRSFLGIGLNVADVDAWVGAAWVLLCGAGLFELSRREWLRQWRAKAVAKAAMC